MYNLKLTYSEDSRVFVTSDSHYNHVNICRGTSKWDGNRSVRDFDTLEQMNDAIVNGINSVVRPQDVLIHLGDWSFNGIESAFEFRRRLNVKTIYLVLGNHDEHIFKNKNNVQELFNSVYTELDLDIKFTEETIQKNQKKLAKQRFFCYHHPVASWREMGKGVIHLHGHVHLPKDKIMVNGKHIDCGADGNNYIPHDIKNIYELMKQKSISKLVLPQDHHEL